MKYLLIAFVGIILASCATKVAYTDQLRDEFGLDSEQSIKKVQFLTSSTIILEKNKVSGNLDTDDDGNLVQSSNNQQNRVIIPAGTKCVFVRYTENGGIVCRFEVGSGKEITFGQRQGSGSGKYYFVADWSNKGGVKYGNEMFSATTASATAYIIVKKKKLNKTKRKDRVVKGMKV